MTAKRDEVETTEALRVEALRLQTALLKKQCKHCGQFAWRVDKTVKPLRYLVCKGCGQRAQVVIRGNRAVDAPEEEGGKSL